MRFDAAEETARESEDEEDWTRYENLIFWLTKVKGSAPTCKRQE